MARAAGFDADVLEAGQLASLAATLVAPDLVVDWEVLHGDKPARAIVAYARATGAGLVALNSHGASTPSRAPFGLTVLRTIRWSPVPVLVTRTAIAPPRPPARVHARPTRAPVTGVRRVERCPRPAPVAAPPSRHPLSWMALVLVGVVLSLTVPLPLYSVAGEIQPAGRGVSLVGRESYPRTGTLSFPVVTSHKDTLAAALRGWLDGDVDVRRRSEFAPDQAVARRVNLDRMEGAKRAARLVALRALGLVGQPITVTIDSARLGGPSAGLAFALAIFDLLTPGELAGGRRVVVTGAIDEDGTVGAVGGVRQKALAARRAGADLLMVPCPNLAVATRYAGTMRVACAATFTEALRVVGAGSAGS